MCVCVCLSVCLSGSVWSPQATGLSWSSLKGEPLPSRGQQQTGQNLPERMPSGQQAPWPSDQGPLSPAALGLPGLSSESLDGG